MADRGRRAMPVDNRITHDKWVRSQQQHHRDRIKNMKSTCHDPRMTQLDNSCPATLQMPHLQLKQKKAQMEEERFAKIELENRVLLEKMSKIMRMDPGDARSCHGGHHTEQFPFRSILQIKPGIRVDMTQYPMIDSRNFYAPKSLNRESRLRELKRITAENQGMLRRIQSREPYYDHKKWEADRLTQLKYLDNCRSREIDSLRKSMTKSSRGRSLPPMTRTLPKEEAAAEPAAAEEGTPPADADPPAEA
jgi:hypothetical protein